MKSDKKILTAFSLNLCFSVFEFIGGIFTGSVAIASDALHDLGDSISIGISYFLERLSRQNPDEKYTYGYIRYSLLGSVITNMILLTGSVLVIYNAVLRLINPTPINYSKMIIFAVIGFAVNLAAAFLTRDKGSLNQKAVNLHMLEDSLGWAVVLVGAVIMRFTDITYLDPIMSIAIAIFILINAAKNLKEVLEIFLEKAPDGINTCEIMHHLSEIEGVEDIHHLHLRSLDGYRHAATLHIVTSANPASIKAAVREELAEHGIIHSVIETESVGEECTDKECHAAHTEVHHTHHHAHHHRH